MSRRLNPLLLIGMIGIFTAGSLFAEKYVEAKWGNEDIWWTPRSLALPLAETRGELMVLVAGEPLQKHLDRGSLSVADRSGKSQRVVADTVRVRLNNWQRRKASLLDHAVYLALLLGSSVTFVGFGIARLVARRRGGDQQG